MNDWTLTRIQNEWEKLTHILIGNNRRYGYTNDFFLDLGGFKCYYMKGKSSFYLGENAL